LLPPGTPLGCIFSVVAHCAVSCILACLSFAFFCQPLLGDTGDWDLDVRNRIFLTFDVVPYYHLV
jgi:hypothetical protein